jgi:hypothetical protein
MAASSCAAQACAAAFVAKTLDKRTPLRATWARHPVLSFENEAMLWVIFCG